MISQSKKTAIKTIAGVVVAILLFFGSGVKIPSIDTAADNYFEEAITKAGIAYSACRIVNAGVSIIKDSQLNIEPAGVGISVALGQFLDPVDDMVERLSDVLVTAITSLGVQKLAYEMSLSFVPPVLSVLLLLMSILLWFKNEKIVSIQKKIVRLALIVLIARLFLPISSLTNNFVYNHFFAPQIDDAYNEISVCEDIFDKIKNIFPDEEGGFINKIQNSSLAIKAKTADLLKSIWTPITNMRNIVENLLKLTFLYVGVFVFQVILFPLLSFWILVKIFNELFHQNVPVIIRHSKSKFDNTPAGPAGS